MERLRGGRVGRAGFLHRSLPGGAGAWWVLSRMEALCEVKESGTCCQRAEGELVASSEPRGSHSHARDPSDGLDLGDWLMSVSGA